jgi:hypothetical protein
VRMHRAGRRPRPRGLGRRSRRLGPSCADLRRRGIGIGSRQREDSGRCGPYRRGVRICAPLRIDLLRQLIRRQAHDSLRAPRPRSRVRLSALLFWVHRLLLPGRLPQTSHRGSPVSRRAAGPRGQAGSPRTAPIHCP